MPHVNVGTTFHSAYADSNPEWIVDSVEHGVARCHIINSPDWNGVQDVFDVVRIHRHLAQAENIAHVFRTSEEWWAAQTPGATLHYHNSFGQFIRGTVVATDLAGSNGLLPTAMVGRWSQHDRYTVRPTGEIVHGYHARSILEDPKPWQPHATNMFEHPKFSGVGAQFDDGNPADLPELALNPPPFTPEEQSRHTLERLARDVAEILTTPSDDPAARLTEALDLLESEALLP